MVATKYETLTYDVIIPEVVSQEKVATKYETLTYDMIITKVVSQDMVATKHITNSSLTM